MSRRLLTPPLKWHGGKSYLAADIIKLMPPRANKVNPDGWLHYVEPYAGGLAVLLHNDPEGISEVVNDIDHRLTTFWKVLQRPDWFASFQRTMQATPFSQVEWERSGVDGPDHDPVAQACRFFVRCRQSLAGRMTSFAPLSKTRTRRDMNEQASAWMNAVDGLFEVHARMRRVVVLCADGVAVIKQQDGPNTLFYVDSPYVCSTRTAPDVYAFEMTDDQHRQLVDTLARCVGKVMVSNYHNPIYDVLHTQHGWTMREFSLPNNAASGSSKRRMVEVLWTNY